MTVSSKKKNVLIQTVSPRRLLSGINVCYWFMRGSFFVSELSSVVWTDGAAAFNRLSIELSHRPGGCLTPDPTLMLSRCLCGITFLSLTSSHSARLPCDGDMVDVHTPQHSLWFYMTLHCMAVHCCRGNMFVISHCEVWSKQDLCWFPLHCADLGVGICLNGTVPQMEWPVSDEKNKQLLMIGSVQL